MNLLSPLNLNVEASKGNGEKLCCALTCAAAMTPAGIGTDQALPGEVKGEFPRIMNLISAQLSLNDNQQEQAVNFMAAAIMAPVEIKETCPALSMADKVAKISDPTEKFLKTMQNAETMSTRWDLPALVLFPAADVSAPQFPHRERTEEMELLAPVVAPGVMGLAMAKMPVASGVVNEERTGDHQIESDIPLPAVIEKTAAIIAKISAETYHPNETKPVFAVHAAPVETPSMDHTEVSRTDATDGYIVVDTEKMEVQADPHQQHAPLRDMKHNKRDDNERREQIPAAAGAMQTAAMEEDELSGKPRFDRDGAAVVAPRGEWEQVLRRQRSDRTTRAVNADRPAQDMPGQQLFTSPEGRNRLPGNIDGGAAGDRLPKDKQTAMEHAPVRKNYSVADRSMPIVALAPTNSRLESAPGHPEFQMPERSREVKNGFMDKFPGGMEDRKPTLTRSTETADAVAMPKYLYADILAARVERTVVKGLPEGTLNARSIMTQVMDGISTDFKDGGRVRITLYPETLGRVDMDIVVRQDRVELIMKVDNDQVHQLLNTHIEDLKATLQSQGWQVSGVDVLLQKQNNMNDGNNFGNLFAWQEGMNHEQQKDGMMNGEGNSSPVLPMSDPTAAPAEGMDYISHGLSIFA